MSRNIHIAIASTTSLLGLGLQNVSNTGGPLLQSTSAVVIAKNYTIAGMV